MQLSIIIKTINYVDRKMEIIHTADRLIFSSKLFCKCLCNYRYECNNLNITFFCLQCNLILSSLVHPHELMIFYTYYIYPTRMTRHKHAALQTTYNLSYNNMVQSSILLNVLPCYESLECRRPWGFGLQLI